MIKKVFLLFIIASSMLLAQKELQTFLSLKNTGVAEFLEKHPEYDGRGTIIVIFDTGVDMGIDGLTKTSTGEIKVIDVQDFTGQGDVEFFEAEIDEIDYQGKEDVKCFVNEEKGYQIAGVDQLKLKPADDKYYIGLLPEKLWMNSGSGASDINGNGTEDDKFYFVTFKVKDNNEEYWVVYIDNDLDGSLANNEPIRNYKEKKQSFVFPNKEGLPNLTIGLNIFPEKNIVNFHFDDGAHGTHCAGIAAGYQIGDDNLNGVAPGAYVISCKLGNNNFSGGSTVSESMKKSFLYADKIAKETKMPVIVNMSFGIGSEIEANSDMEKFIEELVEKNPYLYLCTSNGNEGPGISTAGLPSASPYIFSSGAVLAKEVASDDYGCTIDKDIVLYFSSRGGEVSKPDVISPGACTSTVPNWETRDVYWGTSMASPYTTGVLSLLLSAAQKEFPDVKIPSLFLYKVVRESATHWKDYDFVDQGSGYVNVVKAWELLKKYIKSGELKRFETYSISSLAPNMPGGKAQNLYIRNGNYIKDTDVFNFVVKRNNFINKKKFFRSYKIKTDAEWLTTIQKNVYIRNNQPAVISVKLKKDKMKKPGLYNTKIYAFRKGTNVPEFEMMATVVIPTTVCPKKGYKAEFVEKLAPGMFERHFIKVPSNATSMKVTLESLDGKYASSRFLIHDPDGIQIGRSGVLYTGEKTSRNYFNLKPGIYEVVTTGFFRAKDTSHYKLVIELNGINRIDNGDLSLEENSLFVENEFDKLVSYNVDGKIEGYKKEFKIDFDGNDLYKYPFTLKKNEKSKVFKIKISKEDYNKTTDFPIEIYDSKGKSVSKTGMSFSETTISIRNNGKDSVYTLYVRPAFANAPSKMRVFVEERTYVKAPQSFSVKGIGRYELTFYPSIPTKLTCGFEKPEFALPEGNKYFGNIYFKKENETEYKLPVEFKF